MHKNTMTDYGYGGKILKVDLSAGKTSRTESREYTDRFIGGRGLAARLFWEMVPPETGALEPENCLVCASGPVAGFFGFAGCRWEILGKTPLHQPETVNYGNLGGKWGTALKYAGFDALAVQGRADRPVYLYIHDGVVETKDAADLWGLTAFETLERLQAELGKGVSILAGGPAAENRVAFATVLADGGASASGGIGAILGSKNLKAIAVAGSRRPEAAHPDRMEQIRKFLREVRKSSFDAPSPWAVPGFTRPDICYGCGLGCSRQSYKDDKGKQFKSFCMATGIYGLSSIENCGNKNEAKLLGTRLCDGYGLDAAVMAPQILWLFDCYKEGVINEKETGLPFSRPGSVEFIETLTRKIAFREGFGNILAEGTLQAAAKIGSRAQQIASRYISTTTAENKDYDPRMTITTSLLYATEPRRPISALHMVGGNLLISWASWARGLPGAFFTTDDLHTVANRFWGSEIAADFSTYEGKALAAKTVQDSIYAKSSLVVCDVHWPMKITSASYAGGHVGDPALESQLYSAITGRETDAAELNRAGERIFNLQRAILLRQGWGGRDGDRILDYYFTEPLKKGEIRFNPEALMPGREGKLVSMVGATLDRQKFEKMKDEYYQHRGWNVGTGLPTKTSLAEIGLGDIIDDLAKRKLIGEE
jgi:aldehyde:ferredoxin oxidoreductase